MAAPYDAGSYVAIYWVEQDRHTEHFDDWSRPQVKWLYENGRGFPERTHAHTVLYDHLGAAYRDDDPVPVALALDHGYDGLVAVWFDARDGRAAADLAADLDAEHLPALLKDSALEIAASWTPHPGEDEAGKNAPMPLGTRAGGPQLLAQLFFCHGDVRETLPRLWWPHAVGCRVASAVGQP
ncbi:hypothetical protein [Yinghuangia sp. YIM S09857]|uniref:hypothetical protein n=1 Tax=Yinghuangia sp. YIM S09857 TaxID=3436929 RepID=UPI003F529143